MGKCDNCLAETEAGATHELLDAIPPEGSSFDEVIRKVLRAGTACLFNPSKPLKRPAKSDLRNGASSKLSSSRIFARQMMDNNLPQASQRRQPAANTRGVLRAVKRWRGNP